MTAVPGPDPEELRRLIVDRLGPIRKAEIEAHVEAGPPCQHRLERLTVRRAWDRDDRAPREATWLDGQALDDMLAPERARLLSDPALRPLRLGRGAGVPQQVSH